MGPLDDIFMASAKSIQDRSADGMAVLAKLIALGGLAMSLSHATTPMSGYEHVMSHILDLQAETTHKPLAQHGTQVALATLLAVGAYQHFLEEFDPNEVNLPACYPTSIQMEKEIREAFLQIDPTGKAGEECWADYHLKLEAWQSQRGRFEGFLKNWPAIRPGLESATRSPERLMEIMKAVNSPLTFEELVPPVTEAQARFAFMKSPLMRKRLTLGDLFIFLNWDRDQLWHQVWKRTQTLATQ
jgi:glycerol-1-phosphate dehydrogenase [NAD(P)+]